MWLVGVLSATISMAACSDSPLATPPNTAILDVPETLALTGMPEPLLLVPTLPPPASFEPLPTSSTSSTSTPSTVPLRLASGAVAEAAAGNRVLLIGDSILASTAPRFGGPMCEALVSYGWAPQIEAEEARHIEFAAEVLDDLIPEGSAGEAQFDVVMIMLGNNYRGDIDEFTAEYEAVLQRLRALPVVVYTVSEDEPAKVAVNDVIEGFLDEYDNVILIDWAAKSAEEPDRLLGGDDLHLTDLGRDRLALFTIAALGQTDVGSAECLDPVFTDDSGG